MVALECASPTKKAMVSKACKTPKVAGKSKAKQKSTKLAIEPISARKSNKVTSQPKKSTLSRFIKLLSEEEEDTILEKVVEDETHRTFASENKKSAVSRKDIVSESGAVSEYENARDKETSSD